MSNADDHRWDLHEEDKGYLPESDEAYEQKFEEWQARDWPDWLAKHLTFPFTVIREEDEDDAYFASGAAKAPFRLGHKMDMLELAEEDVDRGMLIKVRENPSLWVGLRFLGGWPPRHRWECHPSAAMDRHSKLRRRLDGQSGIFLRAIHWDSGQATAGNGRS